MLSDVLNAIIRDIRQDMRFWSSLKSMMKSEKLLSIEEQILMCMRERDKWDILRCKKMEL